METPSGADIAASGPLFLCMLGAKVSSPCLHECETQGTAHHRRPFGPEMWARPQSRGGSPSSVQEFGAWPVCPFDIKEKLINTVFSP